MFEKAKKLILVVAVTILTVIMVTLSSISVSAQASSIREFFKESVKAVESEYLIDDNSNHIHKNINCCGKNFHTWHIDVVQNGEPIYVCSQCRKRTTNVNHVHKWEYIGMSEMFHTIRCKCGYTKQASNLDKPLQTPNIDRLIENNETVNTLMNFMDTTYPGNVFDSRMEQYKAVLDFIDVDYLDLKCEINNLENRIDFLSCLTEENIDF